MNPTPDEVPEVEQQGDDAVAMAALQALLQRFSFTANPMQQLLVAYDYGTDQFSSEHALEIYEHCSSEASQLSSWASENGDPDIMAQVSGLLNSITESYSTMVALTRWDCRADELTMSDADHIIRYVKTDGSKDLPIQVVTKFILQFTNRLQLRHRGEKVFVQKFTDTGRPTHAWIAANNVADGDDISTLDLLVGFICKKAHSIPVWATWLATNTKAVVEKLRMCAEPEFKILKTTRCFISFRDGLFNVYMDAFIRYGQEAAYDVPSSMAACAFHDIAFEPAFSRVPGQLGIPLHPLLEVSTPMLDKISDTQKFCGHTRFWLYAMVRALVGRTPARTNTSLCVGIDQSIHFRAIWRVNTFYISLSRSACLSLSLSLCLSQLGRCLYFSNVLESWQVCPMLKGRAGTGKSTLLQCMSRVYEPCDTVIISNDSQAGFGLQAITPATYLWCVPELKTDFNVDQAQFQSLVAQERMSIARKFLPTADEVIRAHGIMAGNTLPLKWSDNSGSIARRLFIFEFNHTPPKSDGNLLDKLCTVELPFLLRKVNWCYRHAAVLLNGQDLWRSGLLPRQILRSHEAVYVSMNSLKGFLVSSHCSVGPLQWCPLKEFQASFKSFCVTTNRATSQWTDEFTSVPFKDHEISTVKGTYVWGINAMVYGTILRGVTVDKQAMTEVQGAENPMYDPPTVDINIDYFSTR